MKKKYVKVLNKAFVKHFKAQMLKEKTAATFIEADAGECRNSSCFFLKENVKKSNKSSKKRLLLY